MRILVFGASVTYGAWDSEGGWVDRLKRKLHADFLSGGEKHQVFNLGVGGQTTADLLDRLGVELQARANERWPLALIFSCGTNDERRRVGAEDSEVSLEQFADNIRKIIDLAHAYTDKLIFLGEPPLMHPEITLNDNVYLDERVKQYDETVKNIVNEQGIIHLSLRSGFEAHATENLYYQDGLHPNDNGHKLIADVVLPELDKLLTK